MLAQTLSIPPGGKYRQITPAPIPVNKDTVGSPGVGILQLDLRTAGATAYIGEIVIELNVADDTLGTGWVTTSAPFNVKAYLNAANKYNAKDNPANGGQLNVTAVAKTATTITLTVNDGVNTIAVGSDKTLWVACDYPVTVSTPRVVSYFINRVRYGNSQGSTTSSFDPGGDPTTTGDINDYRATFSAAGIVQNAQEDQGETDVQVLRLAFGNTADENVIKQLSTITLEYLGSRPADIPAGGVNLYQDANGNNSYDEGTDLLVSSGNITAGTPPTVRFPPLGSLPITTQFANAEQSFFVLVNVATNAVVGNTVGFRVAGASDLVFTDFVDDGGAAVSEQYDQVGYIPTGTTFPQPSGSNSFTITELYIPTPPTVISIVPGDGASGVLRNSVVTAEFSEAMDASTIVSPATNFILFIDNNFNSVFDVGDINVSGTVGYDAPTRKATFTPASSLDWTTTYTALVKGDDTFGGGVKDLNDSLIMTLDKVWVFSTQVAVYPIVAATSPATDATDVLPSVVITADFSKDMVQASVEGAFSLKDGANDPVAGTALYDVPSRTLSFTPSSPLTPGAVYTATITTSAQATDGLALQADKVWSFFTSLRPVVLSTSPVNGEQGVARASTVTATFSKAMNAATITTTSFNLKKGATTVGGSVSYDVPTRTATFTPATDLDWGSTYTVTVTAAVTDTDGIQPASDTVWTFDTIAAVNPVVSNTVPAPDMTGVLPGVVIVATFSKDMKAGTISGSTFLLKDQADAPVAGAVSFDGARIATFTPTLSLQLAAQYTATITTGAEATDDLPLLADKVWSFWTTSRPSVTSLSPLNNATGVPRASAVRATFSKGIDPATIVSPAANFILFIDNNGNSTYEAGTDTLVPGTVSYDASTFTATFTPDADLDYAAYTVTISTGVQDPDGIAMGSPRTWSFSTVPALSEPIVAGNRLVPGGNQQALIFVTQPPSGPSDRVTVQVFTASGKRVATLANNLPFSSISIPIVWDGTNGRGEKLGPGLYYVQIRATNYKRVLKVMIVR